MKTLCLFCTLLITSISLKAQDIITLKTGETINGKVTEVGISEIRYYKATNLQGPVYVSSKADVIQIMYANGTKDVFTGSVAQQPSSALPGNVAVPQQTPQIIVVESPEHRSRFYRFPIIIPHIDLGHHINLGHHGGHHRRHH